MVAVTFISAGGDRQTIEATEGHSLMESAVAGGIEAIEAVCSGNAYCGTCRVYPEGEWRDVLGPATEIERPMIEITADATPGVRLSCQITVTADLDGLVVLTPESQG